MRQQAAAQEVKEAEAVGHPERAFSPILVPVDFSPYSMRALERAAELAERFDAMMVVLHVVDDRDDMADISDDDIKTVLDHQREQAYQALQAFLPPRLAKPSRRDAPGCLGDIASPGVCA